MTKAMIVEYLPWLLSAITVWMTMLAGNLHRRAWLVGLANQALWLVWIVAVGAWGLLPLNSVLWVVYARNHLKWRKAPRPDAATGQMEKSDPDDRAFQYPKASKIKPATAGQGMEGGNV